MNSRVLMDLRWPIGSGIHRVAEGYSAELPVNVDVIDVSPDIRIGHPASPWFLTQKVRSVIKSSDIFFSPGFVPLASKLLPSVVTIHDLTHIHYYSSWHKIYYDRVLRPMYKKCEAIICVSEFTRTEFLEWSGISQNKVFHVPNGLAANFASATGLFSHERPFVFYPGNHRGYKNLANLIIAFSKSKLANDNYDLLLTGPENILLRKIAVTHSVSDRVQFLGFLSDDDLVACYRKASCMAFISRYEGFGLPLLEAMAVDTPVVAARSSSLIEVAGDAALLVSPDDVEEIAAALRTACLDSSVRADLIAKGRKRVAVYDIVKSGKMAWDVVTGIS